MVDHVLLPEDKLLRKNNSSPTPAGQLGLLKGSSCIWSSSLPHSDPAPEVPEYQYRAETASLLGIVVRFDLIGMGEVVRWHR